MNPIIHHAITERRQLCFIYEGLPRVVEPHTYGATAARGDSLRAYQVGGASSSGGALGWRMFTESLMSDICLGAETFDGPRPGYKRDDSAMTVIHAQL